MRALYLRLLWGCTLILLALLTACSPATDQAVSMPLTATTDATQAPAPAATASPTADPTATASPTTPPTATPTDVPSPTATATDTIAPSATPTDVPTPADTPTPQPTPTPLPNSMLQIGLDFPPDGAVLALDGEAILLYKTPRFVLIRASDGEVMADFELPGKVTAFDVAGNKPLLAVSITNADGGSDIQLLDVTTGTVLHEVAAASKASISGLRFSPDGTTLFSASPDHMVQRWSTADGVAKGSFAAQRDQVTCMAVAPDGLTVVTGSFYQDKDVNAWSADGKLIQPLTTRNSHCYRAVFSPDGAWLFYHTGDKMSLYRTSDWTREWLADYAGTASLFNLPERASFIGFTPDSQLYMGSRKGKITVMNPADQTVTDTLELGALVSFAFSAGGERLVVVRPNRLVEIVDLTRMP